MPKAYLYFSILRMQIKPFLLSVFLFLLAGNVTAQQKPLSADSVMKKAYVRATAENKKVLLMFHASWCVWCRRMDSSLADAAVKKLIDRYFIIEHLTVLESKGKEHLENPGAQALMDKFEGKDQGLPYWVILDKDGQLIADSQIRTEQPDGNFKGSNVGCPASQPEVDFFIALLKKTTTLTTAQLDVIAKRFRKNEL